MWTAARFGLSTFLTTASRGDPATGPSHKPRAQVPLPSSFSLKLDSRTTRSYGALCQLLRLGNSGAIGRTSGPGAGTVRRPQMVESRCDAVAVGRTYLFPPLSSGGALVVRPWLRFHIPLIEPDVQISRIRLSDKTSRLCFRVQRHLQFLNPLRSL